MRDDDDDDLWGPRDPELWIRLDPEAPGLDEETRSRRRILAEWRKMSPEENFQVWVDAGVFTPDGELTPPYASDEPSAYRPKD